MLAGPILHSAVEHWLRSNVASNGSMISFRRIVTSRRNASEHLLMVLCLAHRPRGHRLGPGSRRQFGSLGPAAKIKAPPTGRYLRSRGQTKRCAPVLATRFDNYSDEADDDIKRETSGVAHSLANSISRPALYPNNYLGRFPLAALFLRAFIRCVDQLHMVCTHRACSVGPFRLLLGRHAQGGLFLSRSNGASRRR
jgi:hypothetical protein